MHRVHPIRRNGSRGGVLGFVVQDSSEFFGLMSSFPDAEPEWAKFDEEYSQNDTGRARHLAAPSS